MVITVLLLSFALQGQPTARRVYGDPPSPKNESSKEVEPQQPDCASMCKVVADQCEQSCRTTKKGASDRDCRVSCKAARESCADNCLKAMGTQKKR